MNFNHLLIIDTETGGLDSNKYPLIEIGAIFYSTEHRSIISNFSILLPTKYNGSFHINKIDPKITNILSEPLVEKSLNLFQEMIYESDVIVAHNAVFDKKFLMQIPFVIKQPWICTTRVRWPSVLGLSKTKNKLSIIAEAHRVPVHNAHRALTDCILLANIFSKYKKEKLYSLLQPHITY